MKGTIEVRFFMFLAELAKERNWPVPLSLEIDSGMTGLALLDELAISLRQVEALMVNGKVVGLSEARLQPGDKVALLPPGTPGPYRVLLGIKSAQTGSEAHAG